MSEYNQEQSEAFVLVRKHFKTVSRFTLGGLRKRISNYLAFRKDVDSFLKRHFSGICTEFCYRSQLSACCGREGITTFFADVVINVMMSGEDEMEAVLRALNRPQRDLKCVYLGPKGCLWTVKPIVCEMFLCKHAREAIFGEEPGALKEWERLERRAKRYTWPNRPVLFDGLETYFVDRGFNSSLMYCHNSPGLLRVKALAQKRDNRNKEKQATSNLLAPTLHA